MSRAAAVLLVAVATACASSSRPTDPARPPPGPRLTLIAGDPAPDPAPSGCDLAAWTAPWGSPIRICMEPGTAIAITPRDVTGFRIEDRRQGDQHWYFVSAYLAEELRNRIWRALGTDADVERPYAILVDDEPSIVQPAIGIDQFDSLVAATHDLARAEAIAYGWGVPVTRVISAEIAQQPMLSVSMVQLIANPSAWIGKRISIQGYLPNTALGLYLSRDHAESLDHASSIDLLPPATGATSAEALSACEGRWVLVEAFVDSYGGSPRLTRVERLTGFPGGPVCWPPAPEKRWPHY